jgi:exosortase/archaeosortase family protein
LDEEENSMQNRVMWILLAVQMAAYAPVWKWYILRMVDGSDEPWGLAAFATAIALLRFNGARCFAAPPRLVVPSLLILAYAACYPFLPRLMQAAVAIMALGCTLSEMSMRARIHVPTAGLLLLSLPLVSSFQFYLGYPLRVISGAVAVPLLQLSGLAVVREGTCLKWGNELVSIDAPCSGVRMLWAVLFVTFAVASHFGLNTWRTIAALWIGLLAVLLGNGLRAASLFYSEASIIPMPAWCHEAVGITVFCSVTLVIIRVCATLGGRNHARDCTVPHGLSCGSFSSLNAT